MSAVENGLVPCLTYEWDKLTVGTSSTVIVTEPIELKGFVQGCLMVRVHENNIDADAPGVDVVLDGVGLSKDQPETVFVGVPLSTMTLTASDGPGTLSQKALQWPWPSHARLRMQMHQSTRSVVDNSVRLSVSLLLENSGGSCGCGCGGRCEGRAGGCRSGGER